LTEVAGFIVFRWSFRRSR